MEEDHNFPSRLARLESAVEMLTKDVSSLAEVIRTRSTTNWTVIFGGITLFVLMAGGYVGVPLNNISNQMKYDRDTANRRFLEADAAISKIDDDLENDIKMLTDRISAMDVRVATALADTVDRLDAVIQREMRLLDEILQRELKLSDDQIRTLIQGVRDELTQSIQSVEEKAMLQHQAQQELLTQKAADRYTGSQGKVVEDRLLRLENEVHNGHVK